MKTGDKVHYHPLIGEPHTGTIHEIKSLGTIPSSQDPQAWITGKSGCVALDHLSLVEDTP